MDLVLGDAAGRLVGIKVQGAAALGRRCLRGLAALTGSRFLRGVVLPTGRTPVPLGARMEALPVASLWA